MTAVPMAREHRRNAPTVKRSPAISMDLGGGGGNVHSDDLEEISLKTIGCQ